MSTAMRNQQQKWQTFKNMRADVSKQQQTMKLTQIKKEMWRAETYWCMLKQAPAPKLPTQTNIDSTHWCIQCIYTTPLRCEHDAARNLNEFFTAVLAMDLNAVNEKLGIAVQSYISFVVDHTAEQKQNTSGGII